MAQGREQQVADKGGGGAGKNDPEYTMILLVLVSVFAAIGLWFAFGHVIANLVRWLRVGELWVIGFFTDQVAWEGKIYPIDTLRQSFANIDINALGKGERWDLIGRMTAAVAPFVRWPVAGMLGLVSLWVVFKTPGAKYRKRFSLESLIGTQAQSWPVISPVVTFNPGGHSTRAPGQPVPARLPMFAEALSPPEWLAHNRVAMHEGQPDREAIKQGMVRQLGKRWRGPDKLPDHARALYAAFALKGVQRRQESDALLGEIARCWSHEGGFRITSQLKSKIDKLVRDPKVGGMALRVADRHAFTTTALMRTLAWARENGGVLAPATFVWLRAHDRGLWYPLNNVGRRSFHAEASGAMAHFMAERMSGKPLPAPKIDAAVVAIETHMTETAAAIPALKGGGQRRRKKTNLPAKGQEKG